MVIGSLWVVQVLLFVWAWVKGSQAQRGLRLTVGIKMFLSFSLVVSAFLIYLESLDTGIPYAKWILPGMLLSFVGDLLMAQIIKMGNYMVGGMIAFMGAHVFYILGYTQTLLKQGCSVGSEGLWIGLLLYGLIGILGWLFFIRNPRKERVINAASLIYALWIGVMASFALALAVALGGSWWITALGAFLFVISDFLIGLTNIKGAAISNSDDWVWLTYVAAQMGIVYGGWLGLLI